MNEVCSLTALCAVSGYKDEILGHEFSENLALLGISSTYNGTDL